MREYVLAQQSTSKLRLSRLFTPFQGNSRRRLAALLAVDNEKIPAPYAVQYLQLMFRATALSPRMHIDDPGSDKVVFFLLCPSHGIA